MSRRPVTLEGFWVLREAKRRRRRRWRRVKAGLVITGGVVAWGLSFVLWTLVMVRAC